jgi:hypothetical protein
MDAKFISMKQKYSSDLCMAFKNRRDCIVDKSLKIIGLVKNSNAL